MQASDGSLLELYTPVGAQVTVTGEDVYVMQMKPAEAVAKRLHVVPASRRRSAMRRKLFDVSEASNAPDATVTMECGSGTAAQKSVGFLGIPK